MVRVCEDMAVVHRLQSGHGEWADDMALVETLTHDTLHEYFMGTLQPAIKCVSYREYMLFPYFVYIYRDGHGSMYFSFNMRSI